MLCSQQWSGERLIVEGKKALYHVEQWVLEASLWRGVKFRPFRHCFTTVIVFYTVFCCSIGTFCPIYAVTFFLMQRLPLIHRSTVGSRAFSVAGPQVWNCLPLEVTSEPSRQPSALDWRRFCSPRRVLMPDNQLIRHFCAYTLYVVDLAIFRPL